MAYTFGMSKIGATSGALGRRYAPGPLGMGHSVRQRSGYDMDPGYEPQIQVTPQQQKIGALNSYLNRRNGGGIGQTMADYTPGIQNGMYDQYAPQAMAAQGAMQSQIQQLQNQPYNPASTLYAGHVPDRPFGMTMPTGYSAMTRSMRGGPGNTPTVSPGSGSVFYHDDQYNPSTSQRRQDDAGVAGIMSQNRAAGSGPYDQGGMNHFGPLASQPQHVQQPVPVGTTYGGRTQIHNIDGREVGLGPGVDPATYAGTPQGVAGAAGRRGVFVQTGPPAYGLSPEMEQRRQAAIERQATNSDMLGANRNIRANREYGAPLRADQFPLAQQAYGQQQAGGSYVNASPGPLGNIADRQAALDRRASGPFAQTTGFDPRETTVNGAIDQFVADSGNWSPQDQQEFVSGINERAASDPQFKKEWDAWLNRNDYDVTTHTTGLQTQDYDAAELQSINALRAMFGKPPLKPKAVDNRGTLPISAYGT